MAGRGPTQRGSHVALGASPTTAPALPNAEAYSERTRAWYATWASSPQAEQFTATDWQRLAMLAPLVDLYFAEPSRNLFAEIRLNEAKLGATPEDRLRLSWRLDPPPTPAEDAPRGRNRSRPDPRRNPT